jgi:hypothetical protein
MEKSNPRKQLSTKMRSKEGAVIISRGQKTYVKAIIALLLPGSQSLGYFTAENLAN